MSLFDDDSDTSEYYYDPESDFQEKVLENAAKLDKHPLEHLAEQQLKAFRAFADFIEQDPHMSKSERIAINADVQEAKDAMERACKVVPRGVVNND